MINFCLKGHELKHEVQTMIQVFYPNRRYILSNEIILEGITVVSELTADFSCAYFYDDGELKFQSRFKLEDKELTIREKKRSLKMAIYLLLKDIVNYDPQWGLITGIRPTKYINELIDSGMDDACVKDFLETKYLTQKPKIELAFQVAKFERDILARNELDDYSIYIGIPFCPTRCLYCSFTSYPLDRYSKFVDTYLDNLIKEMKYVAENVDKSKLMTIYIGGGTPTSLNELQLERLLKNVEILFNSKNVIEYTVEAGRPDTITREKLKILKKYKVDRISINPQTMNQKTLDLIGRGHTVMDIKEVYNMAREEGFYNINMDLILGLPQETLNDVSNTMKEIEKLNPDSVTVHTLAVKRGSRLKEQFDSYTLAETHLMEEMISISKEYAQRMEMKPYYMYRQKNMVGNFENVGYCKKGSESIYNVEIMEEKQTIIGIGAGSTTKIYDSGNDNLSRIFNMKTVEEYNSRIDEMIERKRNFLF